MRLEDWFAEVRDQRLSDKEKTEVYSKILDRTHKGILTKRINFYMRAGVATFAVLWVVVFFLSSWVSTIPTENSNVWPIVAVNQPIWNIVQADYIWELINVEWNITVFDWEDEVDWVNLTYWNKVFLQENARVELVVRQWVKATIHWPAQLALEEFIDESWKKAVVLNLIEWSYFEIVTVQISELNEWVELQDEIAEETVIVKTNSVEIQQMPAQRDMSLTITNDNWVEKVTNTWWDIIVKRLWNSDDWSLTVVWQDQIAVVDWSWSEVKLANTEPEIIEKELLDKQLTIRYEIEVPLLIDDEEDSVIIEEPEVLEVIPTEEPINEIISPKEENLDEKQEIPKEITPVNKKEIEIEEKSIKEKVISKGKRALDQETMTAIEWSLSQGFINKHIRDITINRALGNEAGLWITLWTLQWLVNSWRAALWLSPVWASVTWLASWISELASILEKDYYVPPSLPWLLYNMSRNLSTAWSVPMWMLVDLENKDIETINTKLSEAWY